MALHAFTIDNARAQDKPYKLADGGGLHLLVQPNGNKFWRFRYRFLGVEKMLALGSYPRLARLQAETAARNTFGLIVVEHLERLVAKGAAPPTIEKHRWLLEDVAGSLAPRPISEITPAEVLELLKRVEKSGRRETARRLRATMGMVFRFAIATLRATNDPTTALKGALLQPQVQHRAAILDENEFGGLLRAIDVFDGWPTIKAAIKFMALTCARPGEVRLARRDEINFDKALWRIPAERTKMRRQHDVPLSKQAIVLLQDVWPLSQYAELVFPSIQTHRKPLSENAMNYAFRRMGYTKDEVTAHGFRATASTILNERGYNPDVIEAVLGHQHLNAVRRTYNRASYWPERVKLLQEWADMLDEFKRSGEVAKNAG